MVCIKCNILLSAIALNNEAEFQTRQNTVLMYNTNIANKIKLNDIEKKNK